MKKISIDVISETIASHEEADNPGCYKKVILSDNETKKDSQFKMLNWARIPEGKKFRYHFHQDLTELFIFLKGKGIMKVNDLNFSVGPKDTVFVYNHEKHSVRNTGVGDLEYIVLGFSQNTGGNTVVVE